MTTDKDDNATAAATTAGNGEWIQVKGEDLQVKVRTMDERKEGRKEGRKEKERDSPSSLYLFSFFLAVLTHACFRRYCN